MQYDAVSHGYFRSDDERTAICIEFACMRDVQNRVVLDIGSIANPDSVHVGSDRYLRPDTDIVTERQVAQYNSRGVYHDPLTERWHKVQVTTNIIFAPVIHLLHVGHSISCNLLSFWYGACLSTGHRT